MDKRKLLLYNRLITYCNVNIEREERSASKTGYELRIYSSNNNDATAVSKFSKALEITFVCLEIITCVIATLISIFVL